MPTRAIKAIFFTRFHHERGSHVLHQVPEGSITPSSAPSALRQPLLSFDSITSYLIPNQQFCDRLLTFCVNHYRVIGYPVCIREGRYSRNEFIFNWALVVEESVGDWVAYGEVVRKVGRLLRGLEEQSGFVSREEDGMGVWDDGCGFGEGVPGGSKVHALCEMVLEDLNNYAECMIPIDDSNTVNLKLFPTRPPPPPIYAHQVPVLTISLATLSRPVSSDLTLTRVLPYIDGINSVAQIAQLADTDLSLTRKAIQHLVYYGCLVLLDIFSFSAVYAPSAEIGGFVVDEALRDECARYVRVPRVRWGSSASRLGSETEKMTREDRERLSISSATSQQSDALSATDTQATATLPDDNEKEDIPHETLITLYTSLHQGLTLRNWVLENLDLLSSIDVRRLITFGVIKGFLYRVHKYAIATSTSLPPAPPTSLQSQSVPASTAPSTHGHASDTSTIRGAAGLHTTSHLPAHLHHKPSLASTTSLFVPGGVSERRIEEMNRLEELRAKDSDLGLPLLRFLDGMHCFDEMCTELGMPERMVEGKVKGAGEVQIFSR